MTKRDAICDAALELFAEKGIEATTTREIAQRAGAAEGTLYRHFRGKDDLAEWLHQRCARQLRNRLEEAAADASAPAERLEALVRGVFGFFDEQPTSCTYLLSNRSGGQGEQGADPSPPMALFTDVLADGMDDGTFRTASVPLLAGWILAMVQRTVLSLKASTLEMDEPSAVDRTVEAALRLVAADSD